MDIFAMQSLLAAIPLGFLAFGSLFLLWGRVSSHRYKVPILGSTWFKGRDVSVDNLYAVLKKNYPSVSLPPTPNQFISI